MHSLASWLMIGIKTIRAMENQVSYVPWGQAVLVHALISTIRACPEPSVFAILDSLNEELANLVGCGLRIAMLVEHDLS